MSVVIIMRGRMLIPKVIVFKHTLKGYRCHL